MAFRIDKNQPGRIPRGANYEGTSPAGPWSEGGEALAFLPFLLGESTIRPLHSTHKGLLGGQTVNATCGYRGYRGGIGRRRIRGVTACSTPNVQRELAGTSLVLTQEGHQTVVIAGYDYATLTQ